MQTSCQSRERGSDTCNTAVLRAYW